jgi:hypothetical protein
MRWATAIAICSLLLAGCMDRYWTRPGGTQQGFYQDLAACHPQGGWCADWGSGWAGNGCVSEDGIRQCLRARGWISAGRTHGLDGHDGPLPSLPYALEAK